MRAKKKAPREAITTVAARRNFSDLINRVAYGKDRIVLKRRNRALAAVVPIEDMEWLEKLEELEEREDLKAARKALREAERKGTIPLDEVLKEFNLKR